MASTDSHTERPNPAKPDADDLPVLGALTHCVTILLHTTVLLLFHLERKTAASALRVEIRYRTTETLTPSVIQFNNSL